MRNARHIVTKVVHHNRKWTICSLYTFNSSTR